MDQTASNFDIIQANLTHVDLIAPLFDSYRQFYKQAPDLTGARQFILDRLTNEEAVIFLAVTEGDVGLVGLGFTQLYPSFSSISMKRLWVLYDLFVAPQVRRQGIGFALLERAKKLAIETQARGLVLATATDNPAQKLYEKFGYKRDEGFYHYYLHV